MLIIWGTRRSVQRLAIIMLSCPQGHPAAHTVLKLVTKFTLFFIPLFPIRTRYHVQCTLCGMSGEVDRENAEQLVASAQQQEQAQGPVPQQAEWPQQGRPGGPQAGWPQQGQPGGPQAGQPGGPQAGQPGGPQQAGPWGRPH